MTSVSLEESSEVSCPVDRTLGFPSAKLLWILSLCGAACAVAGSFWSVRLAVVLVVCSASLSVAWTDIRWRRIPNAVSAAVGLFAVLTAALVDGSALTPVLLGALVTAGPMFVMHLVDPRWVGFGDVKLLAALGAVFGLLWSPLGLVVLWIAAVLAVVSRSWVSDSWRRSVPFGFWLSVSAPPVAVAAAVLL